jgi:hypothetical protein
MHVKQQYPPLYTPRLHFGPRVAHCPEATHVCIAVLPSPLPTRMSLHHLTPSHIPHIPPLLLDVPRLSSVRSPASGMGHQAGLVLSSRTDQRMCISHPVLLACRRRPLDTGERKSHPSPVCRTMVHSARTPTTRPLPRPAAIASRHATSRAMQVTSALLVWQAAPAALFTTPHSPSLSLSFMQAHARPYTARPRGDEGGYQEQRFPQKPEAMTPLGGAITRGLLQTLATPSLPVKSQAVVLWPGLMRQPTYDAWSTAGGSGTCTRWEVGPVGCDRGSSGIEGGQEEHGEGGGGHVQGEQGEGQAVMAGPRENAKRGRRS